MNNRRLDWNELKHESDVPYGLYYVAGHYIDDPTYVFTTLMFTDEKGKHFAMDKDFYDATKPSEVKITHWAEYYDPYHPEQDVEVSHDKEILTALLDEVDEYLVSDRTDINAAIELLEEIQIVLEGEIEYA